MFKTPLLMTCTAILVACSSPASRLDMSPLNSSLELRSLVSTIMVRTVSLPSYAAGEELSFENIDGFITSDAEVLWADQPDRAVTLLITRHLNDILNATAGPDPWPFAGLPDVAVDIRVAEMLARADATFRLRGQYFVGGDGIDFPNRASSFDITEAMTGEDLQAVALAQSAALLSLSEDIAQSLAR